MTPIATQIMDVIEARLANITEANGYFRDMSSPDRAKLTPFRDEDLPAVNYWSGVDQATNNDGGGFRERTLAVIIEARDRTRDRPFVDVAAELAQDILVAMDRDVSAPAVSDNPSTGLGGLVSGFYLQTVTPEIGEGQKPWCGATMVFAVVYRVHTSDPLTIVN